MLVSFSFAETLFLQYWNLREFVISYRNGAIMAQEGRTRDSKEPEIEVRKAFQILPKRERKGKTFQGNGNQNIWILGHFDRHSQMRRIDFYSVRPFSTLGAKKPIWLFQKTVSKTKNFAIDAKIYDSDWQE